MVKAGTVHQNARKFDRIVEVHRCALYDLQKIYEKHSGSSNCSLPHCPNTKGRMGTIYCTYPAVAFTQASMNLGEDLGIRDVRCCAVPAGSESSFDTRAAGDFRCHTSILCLQYELLLTVQRGDNDRGRMLSERKFERGGWVTIVSALPEDPWISPSISSHLPHFAYVR